MSQCEIKFNENKNLSAAPFGGNPRNLPAALFGGLVRHSFGFSGASAEEKAKAESVLIRG
jgi:hypothetical protein